MDCFQLKSNLSNSSSTNKISSFTICKGFAAAGHSYYKEKDKLKAGVAFAKEQIPSFGRWGIAYNTLTSDQPIKDITAGQVADLVTDGLQTGIVALGGTLGWPVMCGLGAANYFAGALAEKLLEGGWNWALSRDPNDIIGPESYGPEGFIWNKETFVFKIRFENMENASAPAQFVKVTTDIDPNFDVRSVRLTAFGFNTFTRSYDLSKSTSYLSETIEYDSQWAAYLPDRYEIRVTATVDVTKRQINWQFKTIDIMTGK